MRTFRALASALLTAALVAPTLPTAAARQLQCNSSGGSYNYCPADTRGGVSLVDQQSRARCDYGDTWGFDNGGVWVSNGCRAVFEIGRRGESHSSSKDAAGVALGILALGIIAGLADKDDRPQRRPHHPDYSPPETITCESKDKRYNYCRVRVRDDVQLVRQRSSAACSFGRSWGYDSRGVWVDRGCRADFAVR